MKAKRRREKGYGGFSERGKREDASWPGKMAERGFCGGIKVGFGRV